MSEIASLNPAAAATTAPSASGTSSISEDYETFLKLLTAQIQYQDPLEPMDATTFVSQLAQLSQVEQAAETNETLDSISAQLASSSALTEVEMIGNEVMYAGETFRPGPDGGATLAFDVPSEAEDVTATIVNEAGDVVRTFRGLPTTPDEWHGIAWDGRTDGGAAAAGESFTLKIAALDGEGEEIAANTYVTGRVDSVILDAEAPILGLDSGDYITSEHIIEVTGAGA